MKDKLFSKDQRNKILQQLTNMDANQIVEFAKKDSVARVIVIGIIKNRDQGSPIYRELSKNSGLSLNNILEQLDRRSSETDANLPGIKR